MSVWVNIEDKMPKEGELVIVYNKDYGMRLMYFTRGKELEYNFYSYETYDENSVFVDSELYFKYWHKLPDKPKGA